MKFNISMKVNFYKILKEKSEQSGMGISEYIRYSLRKLWGEN